MQPLRLTLDMAGRLPQCFQSWSFAAPRPQPGAAAAFDAPVLMEAMMLITPATTRAETARPVGTSCRVCPRLDCAGRREPSLIAAR